MTATARGPLRTLILISGRGSNMLAIARAASEGTLNAQILAVISDKPDAAGLQAAADLGIPCRVIAPTAREARSDYDHRLAMQIRELAPDVIALAGFMRVLSSGFVQEFAGRLLNIHPSLLPKYRGLHTHEKVLQSGDAEHGCSVHFVTEELDGGPVLIQARVKVQPKDTVETLSARVQAQEHKIYPMALDWMSKGRVRWHRNQASLDGKPLYQPVVIEP